MSVPVLAGLIALLLAMVAIEARLSK